jgi:hypothetical protein
MKLETQSVMETQILGMLCRELGSREERLEIMHSLQHYGFIEPERRVVFESLCLLRGPLTPATLTVHLNNRGFPDLDVEQYFQATGPVMENALAQARLLLEMDNGTRTRERGFGKVGAGILLSLLALVVVLAFFAGRLHRAVREALMQAVTSAHYQILCPPKELTQAAMQQFATQREPLFTSLDRKLGDAASNTEIKIIFDNDVPTPEAAPGMAQDYSVSGTTIRTGLDGPTPKLDPAADAEALLYVAWGKPGNALIAYWTAKWLVEGGRGDELGMAAADIDRNGSHRKISELLKPPLNKSLSSQDRATLGAAWINEIAELSGPAQIKKLYKAKMTNLNVPEVTRALGISPMELERRWQMWIYAYVAGMPGGNHSMSMPMDMPMDSPMNMPMPH